MIKDNAKKIQDEIINICNQLGREPEDITLVGITKYVDADKVREVIDAGINHIGENRIPAAKVKFSVLNDCPLHFLKHMVGHLQTNKVKDAVALFDVIQSVDSVKLVQEIEKQAEKIDKNIKILLQVNTAFETQKHGFHPEEVLSVMDAMVGLKKVSVVGLMTMAPFTEDENIIRRCFRDLKDIYDKVSDKYKRLNEIKMEHLSMGMSGDYRVALEEGSNMLRIGSALFK